MLSQRPVTLRNIINVVKKNQMRTTVYNLILIIFNHHNMKHVTKLD